ncbi:MAG: hypothetical protein ACREQM_02560 [Candidatus Dormibacteraceae bacterium]
MRLVFTDRGWDVYPYWRKADRAILERIEGWFVKSLPDRRRFTQEHRLDGLVVLQARYHYR